MSCPTVMYDSTMGFGCTSNAIGYYYNQEYVQEDSPMSEFCAGQEQELIGFENEDVSQYETYEETSDHFMPYIGEEESLDSAYQSEDFDFPNCCSLMDEDEQSSMSSMKMSPASVLSQPDQVALQIQRNEELIRLLSPVRKCNEQLQQTRKNAENARRKFSLTNGIRPKRQSSLNLSPKPAKLSVSVRRWQSEILSKLPKQLQCRKNNAPNARWPEQCKEFDNYSSNAQRRFSLQPVPEWKHEDLYCSSR